MNSPADITIHLDRHPAAERTTPTIGALVLTLGIASIAADHLEVRQPAVFNLHLAFGICLWLAVARCLLRHRAGPDFDAAMRYDEYSRRLSRWVYILLYVLAAVRLAFHLGEIMRLPAAAYGIASHAPHSLDDFQIYIVYALVPLWAMRFMLILLPRPMGNQRSSSG